MSRVYISDYVRSLSWAEKALSGLSNVFYLDGTQYTVFKGNKVQQGEGKVSWGTIALKIAFYVLFLPLTLALFALRCRHQSQYRSVEHCQRIDKLGPEERFIKGKFMESLKKKNIYLFKLSRGEMSCLIFSKNSNLKSSDFSPGFKQILKINSLITQRIAMCFYASTFLYYKVNGMKIISMGNKPHKEENCLIEFSMAHHQVLFQDLQKREYIILDPTWPRFEQYQSIALLASSETDLREIYKIAFGRDYKIESPFTDLKEAAQSVCVS